MICTGKEALLFEEHFTFMDPVWLLRKQCGKEQIPPKYATILFSMGICELKDGLYCYTSSCSFIPLPAFCGVMAL